MYELVDYIVSHFVDKSQYELVVIEDGDNVEVKVLVDRVVITNVIGKGGKLAKSIRTLVRSAGQKLDKNYSVSIEER